MTAQGRIILLVFVVLLAGCGQDNTVAATRATVKEAPTTTGATTTLAPTTSTIAPTTTTTTSTIPETTTTSIPHADQVLPGSFGTITELSSQTNPDRLYPLNAQVVSSLGFAWGEDDIASEGPPEWEWGSLTITHHEGLTVWGSGVGREVKRPGSPYLTLAEDGTWYDNTDEEGPIFQPLMEWKDAQGLAAGCIELGAEVVALEEVIGVTTLHIRCLVDGGDRGGAGSLDVWINEEGYVMKGAYEFWEEPQSGISLRWEVTGLDVQPTGPLPPGW